MLVYTSVQQHKWWIEMCLCTQATNAVLMLVTGWLRCALMKAAVLVYTNTWSTEHAPCCNWHCTISNLRTLKYAWRNSAATVWSCPAGNTRESASISCFSGAFSQFHAWLWPSPELLNFSLHHKQKIVLQCGQSMVVQPPLCSKDRSQLQQRSGSKMAASVVLTWSDPDSNGPRDATALWTAAKTSGSANAFTYFAYPSFVNLPQCACMSRGVVVRPCSSVKHLGQRIIKAFAMKCNKWKCNSYKIRPMLWL